MRQVTLVIGGCKSGKSRHALDSANHRAAKKRIFIATSVPFDDEMKQRIHRHRRERGAEWETVDAPVHLAEAVRSSAGSGHVIVVDCLTLWLNNLLMENLDQGRIEARIAGLIEVLDRAEGMIYLVSNEVGAGIVPENPLARQFRDLAGIANQAAAAAAHHVVWMVAGIPVKIK